MSDDCKVPRWETAAPPCLDFSTINIAVVPAYEYEHLKGILRRFTQIPAVRSAVGSNHVKTCNCPMCFALEELKRE